MEGDGIGGGGSVKMLKDKRPGKTDDRAFKGFIGDKGLTGAGEKTWLASRVGGNFCPRDGGGAVASHDCKCHIAEVCVSRCDVKGVDLETLNMRAKISPGGLRAWVVVRGKVMRQDLCGC